MTFKNGWFYKTSLVINSVITLGNQIYLFGPWLWHSFLSVFVLQSLYQLSDFEVA